MKKMATLLLVLIFATPLVAQARGGHPAEGPPAIHNGLWWNAKSREYHDGYLVGYKNGETRSAGHKTPLDSFPAGEIIDGLNAFYGDFRNRNILVDDGIVYVEDQLSGVSDVKLNDEVLRLRAASRPTPQE